MMEITVMHDEDVPVAVAKVHVPKNEYNSIEEALEYAYRWTQNIEGSWSKKDLENNYDANPNVTVVAPLKNNLGLRSTCHGDLMIIHGYYFYRVGRIGFVELKAVSPEKPLKECSKQTYYNLEPCLQCGEDSKGYVYFDEDETFMCEECHILNLLERHAPLRN